MNRVFRKFQNLLTNNRRSPRPAQTEGWSGEGPGVRALPSRETATRQYVFWKSKNLLTKNLQSLDHSMLVHRPFFHSSFITHHSFHAPSPQNPGKWKSEDLLTNRPSPFLFPTARSQRGMKNRKNSGQKKETPLRRSRHNPHCPVYPFPPAPCPINLRGVC